MAYLGKGLDSLTTANITVDRMTGNGSTATMTITLANGVNSVNDISAFVSGIMQRPGTDYTLSGSTLSFTTAPANGLEVVAISHGDSVLDNVADATTITESFKDVSITDANIGGMSASKLTGALSGSGANLTTLNATTLTGALPAISGTNLTNLNAANLTGALPAIDGSAITGVTGYTISASDPAINTNPSGGLGSVWSNSTSGEAYSCTDATTDANVWTNVGSGTDNIGIFQWQGDTYGYSVSGETWTSGTSTPSIANYEKFSFATETDSAIVASCTALDYSNCVSSKISCYLMKDSTFEKFQFASEGNMVSTGTTPSKTSGVGSMSGHSNDIKGYVGGGNAPPWANVRFTHSFSFANDVWAGQHGTLDNRSGYQASGHSDPSGGYGYTSAGWTDGTGTLAGLDRFSFASGSEQDAVNVGTMSLYGTRAGGCSSTTHGYVIGCQNYPVGDFPNVSEKFSFASSSTVSGIPNMYVGSLNGVNHGGGRHGIQCQSSVTHGYASGGIGNTARSGPSGGAYDSRRQIEKWSFANDAITSGVGNLVGSGSSGREYGGGSHI